MMELFFMLILIYNLSFIHIVNLKAIIQQSIYNYNAIILF